jgi:hypothetical protein
MEAGIEIYRVENGALKPIESRPHPAETTFRDQQAARWLNPKLPFGGAEIPMYGLEMQVEKPASGGDPSIRARVQIRWSEEGAN